MLHHAFTKSEDLVVYKQSNIDVPASSAIEKCARRTWNSKVLSSHHATELLDQVLRECSSSRAPVATINVTPTETAGIHEGFPIVSEIIDELVIAPVETLTARVVTFGAKIHAPANC